MRGAQGSGKSACYQLPGLLAPPRRCALVVSPLISLMNDQVRYCTLLARRARTAWGTATQWQVQKLEAMGAAACFLGSAQPDPTTDARALRGEFALIFLTPEKLASLAVSAMATLVSQRLARQALGVGVGGAARADARFLFCFVLFLCGAGAGMAWRQLPQDSLGQLHRARPVAVVAVDEAHCVSEWGHDFRPAYHSVGQVWVKIMGPIIMGTGWDFLTFSYFPVPLSLPTPAGARSRAAHRSGDGAHGHGHSGGALFYNGCTKPLGEQALGGKALGGKALGEKALGEKALGGKALGEKALGGVL
jgi:hypothetical protein